LPRYRQNSIKPVKNRFPSHRPWCNNSGPGIALAKLSS
jgi:hypothetical protein